MASRVLSWERIGDHGELRAFLRDGRPPHLAFEVLRDADGRAWTLRVPLEARDRLVALIEQTVQCIRSGHAVPFDDAGMARLASEQLGPSLELCALILREGGEDRFALWRCEALAKGWSWTLDVVFVPPTYAGDLLMLMREAVAKVGKVAPPPGAPDPEAGGLTR